MRVSKSFRSTLSVLVTAALVAAFAPAVVWLATAPPTAADVPSATVDRPLSQLIDTTKCVSNGSPVRGVLVGQTCVPFTGDNPAEVQFVAVNRTTLAIDSNQALLFDVESQWDAHPNDIEILSAPGGFQNITAEPEFFGTILGLQAALSGGPFSVIDAGCATCTPTVNDGLRLGTDGGPNDLAAGEITGYLQHDNFGNYVYTSPDYIGFDTEVAGSPQQLPVMKLGDRTYEPSSAEAATAGAGDSGFEVLELSAADLKPVTISGHSNPGLWVTNTGSGGATQGSGLVNLASQLATPGLVVLVEAFNSPHAVSQTWNSLADQLVDLGGTRALINSLNNPSAPGLHTPTGYAIAGFTGNGITSPGQGIEAWEAPVGQPVAVDGVLSRIHKSVFAPFLGDSAGVFDTSFFSTVYQPADPGGFPYSTGAGADTVAAIQKQLETVGFPSDTGLRDEYWEAIDSPDWSSWLADLSAMSNPDPQQLPLFAAVKAQLIREFNAVVLVRNVLVNEGAGSPVGAMESAFLSTNSLLPNIATGLEDAIKNSQPKPDAFEKVLGILLNVLSAVAGVAGGPGISSVFKLGTIAASAATLAGGLTSQAAVTLTGALGLAGSITSKASSGAGSVLDKIQTTASQLGIDIAKNLLAAIQQLQQIAEILVADYGKLMSAATDFSSQPAFTSPNADTNSALVNEYEQAGEQEIFNELLPTAIDKGVNGGGHEPSFYPRRCLDTPAGDGQASVASFDANGDPVPQETYWFLAPTDLGTQSPEDLNPSTTLVQALFGPYGDQTVTLGGVTIPMAGLDPEMFAAHLDMPDTNLCLLDVNTPVGLAGGDAVDNTPVVNGYDGAQQHAAAGSSFPEPVTVRVTNAEGMPAQPGQSDTNLPGQASVGFALPTGSALFPDGTQNASTPTISGGLATSPRIGAGTTRGAFDIGVTTTAGGSTEIPLVTEGALTVHVLDGDLQAAPGGSFPLPVAVQVHQSASGGDPTQPAADESVQFSLPADEATFWTSQGLGANTVVIRTDADGYAVSPPITAVGTAGDAFQLTATVLGQDAVTGQAALSIASSPARADTDLAVAADPPSPATVHTPVTISATVSGAGGPLPQPSGSVDFTRGGTDLGSATVDPYTGVAALAPTSTLSVSDDPIKAHFTPTSDDPYGAADASLAYAVRLLQSALTVASTANAAAVGQSITFTASLPSTGTPVGGTVTFTIGSTQLGSPVPVTNGSATSAAIGSLDPGIYNVHVDYSGDGTYAAQSTTYVQAIVGKWNTTITVGSDAGADAAVGQRVVYTVTVASVAPGTTTPTGHVRFLDAFTAIPGCDGLPLTDGTAQCATTYSATGAHSIAVSYSGDSAHEANESDGFDQAVARAHTSTTVSAAPVSAVVVGQPATFTAQVAVTAPGIAPLSGSVEFDSGGAPVTGCGAVPVDAHGVATCTTAWATPGHPTVTAAYSGSDVLAASMSVPYVYGVIVAMTTTTLSVAPSPSSAGQAVQVTADVQVTAPAAGVPTGTITFLDNGSAIAACTSVPVTSGLDTAIATCAITYPHVGAHTLGARYSGDADFELSQAATVQHVVQEATTVTRLVAAPAAAVTGQTVTLSATVQVTAGGGTPTGSVAFSDSGTLITTCKAVALPASGTATCTMTYAHAGAHQFSAAYSGATDFAGGTSAALPYVVAPAGTTLVADKAPLNLLGGYTFTTHLTRSWDGKVLSGKKITITAGNTTVCTATTNAAGTASCKSGAKTLIVKLTGHYVATFAGDADDLPATVTGNL